MYLSTRYLKIENIHINTMDPVLRKTGKSLNDVIIEHIKIEEEKREELELRKCFSRQLVKYLKNNSYFISKYFRTFKIF